MKNEELTNTTERTVLTLNAGSSSLKFAVFTSGEPPVRVLAGAVARVGLPGSTLTVSTPSTPARPEALDAPNHARALEAILARLDGRSSLARLAAAGHRLVHGGPHYEGAELVTPDVLAELGRLSPLDLDHLPAEIAIVEALRSVAPELPQVACFDTSFHRTMPRVARLFALPHHYEAAGVQRYGFHGLSYQFLIEELAHVATADAARGRVVLAHLGSGASLAAVLDGRCVDTTMGFTPNSGIAMGTRSGDLDPGVLVHLLRSEGMSADTLDDLLNRRSGLLGVSGSSSDMRDLLANEATDPRAADAVALFCHQARKAIGALAATLGGMDTLVFSGGIGERSGPVRARIARGLAHLGVQLDDARNELGAPVLSTDASPCTVRMIRTDEESIIARETLHVLDARTNGPMGREQERTR
jgi:acetate kinase